MSTKTVKLLTDAEFCKTSDPGFVHCSVAFKNILNIIWSYNKIRCAQNENGKTVNEDYVSGIAAGPVHGTLVGASRSAITQPGV